MLIALTRFQMISLKAISARIHMDQRQTQSSRLFPKIPGPIYCSFNQKSVNSYNIKETTCQSTDGACFMLLHAQTGNKF